MNDPENVFDVISAIQQGDFDVVHQAIELHHITATAQDLEGMVASPRSSSSLLYLIADLLRSNYSYEVYLPMV